MVYFFKRLFSLLWENGECLSAHGETTEETKLVVRGKATIAWTQRGTGDGEQNVGFGGSNAGTGTKGVVHGDFQVSGLATGRMVAPLWDTKDANRR